MLRSTFKHCKNVLKAPLTLVFTCDAIFGTFQALTIDVDGTLAQKWHSLDTLKNIAIIYCAIEWVGLPH